MYSPASDELKRKLTRAATALFVLALVALPFYMLFIHDSDSRGTAPRVDRESPITEMDRIGTVPEDTVAEQEPAPEPEPRRRQRDMAETERTEPQPRERERTPPPPARVATIAGSDTFEFPQTPENSSITRSYRIRNEGNRTLEISRIEIEGEDQNAFSLNGNGSLTIEPNRDREIEIQFSPTDAGVKNAQLAIISNDARRSPFRVTLRGEATGEESISQIVRNLYDEGRRFFDQRSFQIAEERYSDVLALDPHYGPAYLMRGRSRYEQGEYLAALSDFDNVLKYRLSLPREERERIECITLYYAALSVTEQALRTENESERERLLRPAMGRWEDFKGVCTMDATLIENADFWMQRISELR
jgi:hypothetical protein